MASSSGKVLKATVRLETSNAERALTRVENKINKINQAVNNSATSSVKANQVMTDKFNKTGKAVDSLTKKIGKLAKAYLGVMGARALITTSDTITSAENRLNNLEGGNPKATQLAMDKMFVASQNARTGYADMMSNVSKSMTLAPDAFQGNIENAIRFQEIMAKAYTIGGASAAEQSSSMYQMIQALGSGILQGDELRSVREGAPIAYKKIEEFAQGVYDTEESLKKLASEGKITSDIVVAAMMQAGESIDTTFENTDMTFAQAFTNIKNTATKAFEPTLQLLNDTLNSEAGYSLISGIGIALQFVATILGFIIQIFSSVFNWIAENWYWIQFIVYAVLIALTVAFGIWAGQAIVAGATAFWSFLMGLSPLYIWIIVIGLIIAALVLLAGSVESLLGWIVGIILTVLAVIFNIITGVIDAIIHFLWVGFVEPWIGIIEWVLNVFNGGFNSFGDAVKNLLGNIISWFLSLGQVVTKIIDAIFGTNWTEGLNGLKNKLLKWGKNENAITISRDAAPNSTRINYGDAFKSGYDTGHNIGSWIGNKLSGGDFNIGGDLNNQLNSLGDMGTLGGSYDPSKAIKGIGDTADNTGRMADSMDLTQEDLEYLRRVADMEWKKEFTTATIQVDMTNNNTLNGDSDLDGIVTKLTNKLYEELDSVANGVYS